MKRIYWFFSLVFWTLSLVLALAAILWPFWGTGDWRGEGAMVVSWTAMAAVAYFFFERKVRSASDDQDEQRRKHHAKMDTR